VDGYARNLAEYIVAGVLDRMRVASVGVVDLALVLFDIGDGVGLRGELVVVLSAECQYVVHGVVLCRINTKKVRKRDDLETYQLTPPPPSWPDRPDPWCSCTPLSPSALEFRQAANRIYRTSLGGGWDSQ
jgi:hypothetical protein